MSLVHLTIASFGGIIFAKRVTVRGTALFGGAVNRNDYFFIQTEEMTAAVFEMFVVGTFEVLIIALHMDGSIISQ